MISRTTVIDVTRVSYAELLAPIVTEDTQDFASGLWKDNVDSLDEF